MRQRESRAAAHEEEIVVLSLEFVWMPRKKRKETKSAAETMAKTSNWSVAMVLVAASLVLVSSLLVE